MSGIDPFHPFPRRPPGELRVGDLLRSRRTELGLTLQRVADLVGCARSYLSEIENGKRAHPPGDALVRRLEEVLGFERGRLTDAASWEQTPEPIRRETRRLLSQQRRAQRLARILSARGGLDGAYESGELHRLIAELAPADHGIIEHVNLPQEVPLINKVAAGYPLGFTDLGYPARIADEYVRCPDLHDPDAFAARVVGDSMEPVYREGDVVVFSPARDVTSGADCFVRLETDAETTFKRIYFERGPDGQELIRLQPLNSAYPPTTYDREQIAGLYRAVSVMRRID